MASTSETGHDKNNANIDKVIDFVTQLGATYNPSSPQIAIPGLATLKTQCNTVQAATTAGFVPYKNKTNTREINFLPLDSTCTAIMSHLKTLSIPQQSIDDVQALVKLVHGASNNKPTKTESSKTIDPSSNPSTLPLPSEDTSVSTSHQSYDNRLANFNKIIQLLIAIPSYAPNEANIQIATLTAYATSLGVDNLAANNATTTYFLARNSRNAIFYGPQTGLCDVMKKVKLYIRQVFGTQSAEYKQICTIKFTKYTFNKKKKKKKN